MRLDPLLQLADGVGISLWVLLAAGLLGGLTAGLFGVGGGVLVTPLLISVGVPPRIAAGSMNVAIISNAAEALTHDLPRRRVDWKLGLWMGLAAVVSGQAGTLWIGRLGRPQVVDAVIRFGFLVLLVAVALRLLRERRPPPDGSFRTTCYSSAGGSARIASAWLAERGYCRHASCLTSSSSCSPHFGARLPTPTSTLSWIRGECGKRKASPHARRPTPHGRRNTSTGARTSRSRSPDADPANAARVSSI